MSLYDSWTVTYIYNDLCIIKGNSIQIIYLSNMYVNKSKMNKMFTFHFAENS